MGQSKNDMLLLKTETAAYLRSIDVNAYSLDKTDVRLKVYINECVSNPSGHNLYELLSIKRFFRLLDTYLFKSNEVKAFVSFYERLKFSGLKKRQSYKLTPIQVFQFSNILGFYRTEEKRLCREALLFVPRKFSKTTSVASLAIYDLLFGDSNAQAFVAANSYDQAKICFDEIRNILKSLDRNMSNFKLNREIITTKRPGRTAFIRCLASSPDKLDGLNASMVIVDEYSQSDSPALKNVLTSSMGARVNPLTVVITTAGDKKDSPFIDMLNGYKATLRGEIDNDSIFAHLFEPDVDDDESDPKTWAKVQPHLGVTVQSDYYDQEYRKALLTADDMKVFRTKLLNQFVDGDAKTWIRSEEIEALERTVDIDNINGRPMTMVAVDLSVFDDFSAVSYSIYSSTLKSFHIHTDYYLPEETVKYHPNKDLYAKWIEEGYLKICGEKVIDYQMIANDIFKRNRVLWIQGIGYDSYKSMEFTNALSAMGAANVMTPVPQTYGNFTSPVESFELGVKTGKISFNPNPITRYCFANAVIDEDRNENRKPIKRSENNKIDGAITCVMTFWLYNNVTR